MYEILEEGFGEYTEKKSRFLGVIASVKSEEEAAAFLEAKKKHYHDARHNCSAYRICSDSGKIISRFSDDGEPSGTAGKPILDVLEGEGLVNAICVVTRYFGGVLLGTGGLVRAYTEGAKRSAAAAKKAKRMQGTCLEIETDYHGYGKIEYLLRTSDIPIISTEYGAGVTISAMVPPEGKGSLAARINEATNGLAKVKFGEERGYALLDGRVVFL